jgi:hypothetical protein
VANYGRGARVTAHIESTNNNKQQLAESKQRDLSDEVVVVVGPGVVTWELLKH